jgi:hypothetical protein
MSTVPSSQRVELERLQRGALGVGVLALLACAVGTFFSPAQFFRAYLPAYQFYLGIALGCMAILMLYHLTGGAWGLLIRRLLEAGMRTLPILAVLFLPIACGPGYLYLWARPEAVALNKNLQHKMLYFNLSFVDTKLPIFWWIRAALAFLVWLTIAFLLRTWSRQQDQTGSPGLPRKFRLLSAPGLVAYGAATPPGFPGGSAVGALDGLSHPAWGWRALAGVFPSATETIPRPAAPRSESTRRGPSSPAR